MSDNQPMSEVVTNSDIAHEFVRKTISQIDDDQFQALGLQTSLSINFPQPNLLNALLLVRRRVKDVHGHLAITVKTHVKGMQKYDWAQLIVDSVSQEIWFLKNQMLRNRRPRTFLTFVGQIHTWLFMHAGLIPLQHGPEQPPSPPPEISPWSPPPRPTFMATDTIAEFKERMHIPYTTANVAVVCIETVGEISSTFQIRVADGISDIDIISVFFDSYSRTDYENIKQKFSSGQPQYLIFKHINVSFADTTALRVE
ncbi:hypothetical protein R1sor_007876 [Riccia sorocarpa]|uniref:Uncharacterized protein n=1 Tax=Riccia sorocarpa TaxID=122646 RepID=A0ABD3HVC8_9MARC